MPIDVPADLAKYVGPDVPQGQRLIAARGLVPLRPDQMVLAYYFLAQAPEEPVQQAARKSLTELPPNIVKAALAKVQAAEVLDFYSKNRGDDETLEAIVSNPAASVETLADVGRRCSRYVQTVLANNQRRLMEDPSISEALLANPSLSGDIRAQIQEFRHEFLGIAPEEAGAATGGEEALEEEFDAGGDAMEVLEADDIGLAAADEIDEEDDFPDELIEDFPEGELDADAAKSLQGMIQNMSISQKVRLATLGNKAARQYLVRDSNRLVATAVLRSPRIQEDEIEDISKNRNVDEQVLRIIASNKKWAKNYILRKNLVENPKSPAELTARMIVALNEKDQQSIAKNRNVSTAVRNAARRLISQREEMERRKKEKKK